MKKMYLVLAAIVMAISFSAFTPEKKPLETVWYNLGSGWQSYSNPCPAGTTLACTVTIGQQQNVQLYRNKDFGHPVKYDAP